MTTPSIPGVNQPSSTTSSAPPSNQLPAPTNIPANQYVGTGQNAESWAAAILQGLGAPLTVANINSMMSWFGNEGGGGQNNPLNTTITGFGNSPLPGSAAANNGVAISSYPTPADGVAATVATIKNGSYPNILADLKAGNGVGSNAASNLSEWSGGGYSSIKPANFVTTQPGGVIGLTGASAGGTSGGTGGGGTSGPPSTPFGDLGIDTVLSAAGTLLRDVATVLDYVFGMFGRGQGWRLVFTLVAGATAFMSYKCLAAAGAVPEVHMPSMVVI